MAKLIKKVINIMDKIKQKILIVDDKDANIYALKLLLNNLDVEIIEAYNGNEALLKAIDHDFDLAIIDIQMPEMDGYELAQIMRDDDKTKDIPILFLSAIYSDDFHVFKGFSAGAVDFITKPYKPEILISKVRVFLEIKQQKKDLQKLVIELKKHKENLQEMVDEQAKEIIQTEKLSAIGELSASINHELKQPLNSIQIIVQYLTREIKEDKVEKKELVKYLNDIKSQVFKMAQLMDHMGAFCRNSKVEKMQSVNINVIVKNPFIILGKKLLHDNIQTTMNLDSELPNIKGYAIQLEQVVLNIVLNASYALSVCNKKDKTIKIRTYYVNEDVQTKESVGIEITDNADGMSEQTKEKIFQSFFTTKEPGKGTGLGLSISKRILDNHNAKINVKSEIGIGTTFSILFPLNNTNKL